MNRRQLVKSLISASVASLGGVTAFQYYQQSQLNIGEVVASKFLTTDDQIVLKVFIPVFAATMPIAPDIAKTLTNIDQAILRISPKNQEELRQLLDLIGAAYGRFLLAGVWLNWQKASTASIDTFLKQWRDHRMALLQQAYLGLHQLIMGAIYAEPEAWPGIDYPGPPIFARNP